MSARHALRCICMVCGVQYASRFCASAQDGKLSHGYCPEHGAQALEALRSQQVAHDVTAESFAQGSTGGLSVPPGFVLVQDLGEVCGLSVSDLYSRYRPAHWRLGTQFVVLDSPLRRLAGLVHPCFREAFVGELVGELAVNGQRGAASRLLAWLARDTEDFPAGRDGQAQGVESREPIAPARASPPRPARVAAPSRVGWATEWEGRHA